MRVMNITKKMKDYEVHARIEHLVSLYAGDLLDLHEKFLSPTKQKQIELSQQNTLLEEDSFNYNKISSITTFVDKGLFACSPPL